VLTPTLTGLGERAHLLSPSVNLSTHIRDVTALLEYEDLRDVMLVGHSYGGMVISGAADQAGARLAHLVYLDAFLPEDGKAVKDYVPPPPARQGSRWRTPPPGELPRFGVTDAQDVAWMEARLGDQPTETFTEPVRLTNPERMSLQRSFIRCTPAPFFIDAAERAKRNGFHVREILTGGHDVMITQPDKLTDVLLQLDRT
jgi:pimeloyl-ACP methyl ester carboxylesterase